MATLIIDQRGAALTLVGRGILRLQLDADTVHRVGLKALRQIVISGDTALTTAVIRSCLNAGVAITLLPRRGRQPTLNLLPVTTTGTLLRHLQHRAYADSEQRLVIARQIVHTKIMTQAHWLEHYGHHPDMQRFADATAEAADSATLLGIEGAASARYFDYWGRCWSAPWSFTKRNRRPPRDPVNALLSLSYSLALSYLGRLISLKGLEANIGFLHGPHRERPALALDLLESLRPLIDHWVWRQLTVKKALQPDHFSHNPKEGCRLNKEGRTIYFSRWYRGEDDLLRSQARTALAQVLRALRQSC